MIPISTFSEQRPEKETPTCLVFVRWGLYSKEILNATATKASPLTGLLSAYSC